MAETAYTLNITVRNKIATTTAPAPVVNGNNDYTVVFDFDSEWDSLSSKTAMFVYGREEQKYKTVTFTGNSCVMPALYNTGYVLIGVFAGDIKTTSAAYVKCIPCIRDNDSTLDTGSGGTIDTGTNDHSQLINRDIADQHPISAITGLEEALTPLVGTTQTITPSQVLAAIRAGRDVALQHANPYLGTFVFSAFNANEKLGIVVSNSIIPHLDGVTGTLMGDVEDDVWSFKVTNMATKDDVGTAVNEALAQAKASGEFDGADGLTPTIGENGNWYLGDTDTGKPSRGDKGDKGDKGDTGETGATGATGAAGAAGKSAYQYAQDGGYTGTEAEFAAKLAQEKFANPNALTFTGAVEGSYDGSAPVSVEIPGGGTGGTGETAADVQLASGTIPSGTVGKTSIDTGVTLDMLKQYKRFAFKLKGASNVGLQNTFLRFAAISQAIARTDDVSGVAICYEWINTTTSLLRIYAQFSGNQSLISAIGTGYVFKMVPASLQNGLCGSGMLGVFDLSTVAASSTLKIVLSHSATIDYNWELRGITA